MGAITESIPKPMLPIGGKPMLEHILERLSEAGANRFLIVVGYQREAIESHFRGSRFNVEFRVQQPVNGTGSAGLLARSFASDKPFLLTFGDIMCSAEEYSRAIAILEPDTEGVVAVKAVDDPWQGAAVYVNNEGVITNIVEKPAKGTSSTNWNSAGVYVLRPSIFAYLARLTPSMRKEYELTSAFEAMVADGLKLKISPILGEWRDVGRPEDLAAF